MFILANFQTHKNIGIVSAIGVTFLMYSQNRYLELNELFNSLNISDLSMSKYTLVLMVVFGIIGSLIPDIDLDISRPSRYFRKFIYLVVGFLAISLAKNLYPIFIENLFEIGFMVFNIILLISSFIVSFIGIKIFESVIVHRGIIHSIPFGVLMSIGLYELLVLVNSLMIEENISFHLNSIFISIVFFTGFLTHLLLDELYSVNLFGLKIKESFGTALKLYDKNNIIGTISIYVILVLYYYSFH